MTLEKAILYVIEKEGIGIIGETRFVNYLNDLQAFDMPAVKRIVVTMVSGGYAEKLKHSLTTQNYQLDVNDAKSRLVNNEGFQANLVEYVLNCLLYATKKTTKVPVLLSASPTPAVHTTTSHERIRHKRQSTLDPASASLNANPSGTTNYKPYNLPTLDLLAPVTSSSKDFFYKLPLRAAFSTNAFQSSFAELPICLGVSVQNELHVVDLAELPHLLIAGSTGTGKSVFLNTIILSLLYKLEPLFVKFVLIDPQRVEFTPYHIIENCYLAKSGNLANYIVSDNNDVTSSLISLTQEIDDRYQLFNKAAVRNFVDYNRKWRTELCSKKDERGKYIFEHIPRIVVIIDEFSSYAQKVSHFQNFISYIAGKGRAVGVHLILSTNAIGAQVLTPSIKSLFPARIAFDVPQAQESIRILDSRGAEKLNHKGRLIFKNGDIQVCLQSPYVDSIDILRICKFIRSQKDTFRYCDYSIGQKIVKHEDKGILEVKDRDPLFEEAVRFVVMGNTASTSQLQRRYEIGYNRAGRLMDQMEHAGIVGPAVGSKPRQVLVSPMDIDLLFDGGMPYIPKHIRTPLTSQGVTSKSDPQSNTTAPKKSIVNASNCAGALLWFIIIIAMIAAFLSTM